MRLAYEEQLAISYTIRQADADAMIYLFGSRADNTAKGGDIDLLVCSPKESI
jgi:predicted nucleotidyltransferase